MVIKSPIATLALLCFFLAGCGQSPKEIHWRYASFEFAAGDLLMWTEETSGPESKAEPAPYYGLDSLLTRLDQRNWQFVWTDGRTTIVRANDTTQRPSGFVILKKERR